MTTAAGTGSPLGPVVGPAHVERFIDRGRTVRTHVVPERGEVDEVGVSFDEEISTDGIGDDATGDDGAASVVAPDPSG